MSTDASPPPSSAAKKRGHPELDPTVSARITRIAHQLLARDFAGTVTAMAKALDRHPSSIQKLLDGKTAPTLDTITRLAAYLGVSAQDLYLLPPGSTEDAGIPTPRSKAFASVYNMAQAAGFDEEFFSQWSPTNPGERDPHVLWLECKAKYEAWLASHRVSEGEKTQRLLVAAYFRRVVVFGQRLATGARDVSEAALKDAVRHVYLEPPLSTRPDIVLAVSPSVDGANARMAGASPLALAEHCFRSDIVQSAKETLAENNAPPITRTTR